MISISLTRSLTSDQGFTKLRLKEGQSLAEVVEIKILTWMTLMMMMMMI